MAHLAARDLGPVLTHELQHHACQCVERDAVRAVTGHVCHCVIDVCHLLVDVVLSVVCVLAFISLLSRFHCAILVAFSSICSILPSVCYSKRTHSIVREHIL